VVVLDPGAGPRGVIFGPGTPQLFPARRIFEQAVEL